MNSFQELQLPVVIQKALQAMSFKIPTPIQAKAIPAALLRRDLMGSAQTGTGKTAAFCIPVLVRLLACPYKTALVLVPTRELASQIEAFWKELSRFAPEIGCASLIGGMSMQPQIRALRKRPRLIVATPGRLLDHLGRGTLSLSSTEVLVLDEADRMLDMGFAPQLNQVLRFLPKTRQTLFFSATFPPSIEQLISKYLKDPIRVTVGQTSQVAAKVSQSVIPTTHAQKNEALLDELNRRQGSVLVFARTQHRTDRVARYLTEFGLEVGRIHGGRSQSQRNSALMAFRSGKTRIMIATDIAARGIDVSQIAHVINYDLPQTPEDYVHRIGRTARGEKEGEAVSLVTSDDKGQWREIERLLKKTGSTVPNVPANFASGSKGQKPQHPAHQQRPLGKKSRQDHRQANRRQNRPEKSGGSKPPHASARRRDLSSTVGAIPMMGVIQVKSLS